MHGRTNKMLIAATLAALALTAHAQTSAPDAPTSPSADAQQTPPPRRCSKPEYPKDALRANATGVSTIAFLIGVDGDVRDMKVLKSSGNASLDGAAMTALAKCRFKPARDNGKPVESWQPVQYVWSLQ